MSMIRSTLERRSDGDSSTVPDGYGIPGMGSWGSGMVWQSGGGMAPVPERAMRLSAVFACQRLLTDAVSTFPIDLTRRRTDARLMVKKPGYLEFRTGLSRTDYLSQVMLSLLNDGNAFVATPRNRLGVPVALVPLDYNKVDVRMDEHGPYAGRIMFWCNGKAYSELDVMHIKGMCLPGQLRGVSPIRMAREVLQSAYEAQAYGLSFFQNYGVPPAVIEMPGNGDEADQAKAREVAAVWHETHGGGANAGKVGVLIGDAKLNTVAVSPVDAQWLEARQFGVQEITRFYGVPPHLVGDSSNSTSWGSGLAEQNVAFGQFALNPWTGRIEESHDRLLYSHGQGEDRFKLNMDARMRPATKDRYAAYKVGLEGGWLTIDDVRMLEDLPPLPDAFTPAGLKARADAMGVLIRGGVTPDAAAKACGLPDLTFTGAVPTTLRMPTDDAAKLEDT